MRKDAVQNVNEGVFLDNLFEKMTSYIGHMCKVAPECAYVCDQSGAVYD